MSSSLRMMTSLMMPAWERTRSMIWSRAVISRSRRMKQFPDWITGLFQFAQITDQEMGSEKKHWLLKYLYEWLKHLVMN